MNHAEDKVVFCDPMFVPLLESIQDQLTTIEHFIVLTSEDSMPESSLKGLLCYESILSEQSNEIDWPEFDETTASGMCYTSGTTGDPKGVLYNHRATVLHAYAAGLPDVFGISAKDIVYPSFQCSMSILGDPFMSAQWLGVRLFSRDQKWVMVRHCNN